MSKDLNQCNFIGRLGNDVEMRSMTNGNSVANLSIAVGDHYKDKNTGQKVEQTEWVRIVAFGNLADIMGQYLRKGSKIFVTGKFRTRKWTDQSGQEKYSTEIVASEMQMLDSKPEGQPQQQQQQWGAPQQASQPQQQNRGFDDFDSDIPFN